MNYEAEVDFDACCSNSTRFGSPIGTVIAQLGVETSAPTSAPSAPLSPVPSACTDTDEVCASATIPSRAIAGLAVEGAVLAMTLAGLGYMLWKNRRLNQANTKLEDEKAELDGRYQQQWQRPPHDAVELAHYGVGDPLENPEGRLELSQGVPELSGSPISGPEATPRSASPRDKSPSGDSLSKE